MQASQSKFQTAKAMFRVAFFLAAANIKRSSKWTTLLIILIMMLTFLNMIVVPGILIGLIDGGNIANRNSYTSDVIMTVKSGKTSIDQTGEIIQTLKTLPIVEKYSARALAGGSVEGNYLTRRDFAAEPDTASTQLAGIDVEQENNLTNIANVVTEGTFLEPNDSGYVVLGANLLRRYSSSFGDGFASLDDIYPGDRVKITANGNTKEFIVKGIINSKVNEISLRAFVTMHDFTELTGRSDLRVNEIAIKHTAAVTDDQLKNILTSYGFDASAKIQTATEAIPQFLDQIRTAFGLLGTVIGSIGIIVASITIFIVIFINAVTRRRYIGILKGIGVSGGSLRFAYILQAVVYAGLGILAASAIIYGLLVPAFLAHPLNFPFSDGILVAPFGGTLNKAILLMIIAALAGFVPAWLIIRKNTLASILGRN